MNTATDSYILLQINFHFQQQSQVAFHDFCIFSHLSMHWEGRLGGKIERAGLHTLHNSITLFDRSYYSYNCIKT